MKNSDLILQRAFSQSRGLTRAERVELQEAYLEEERDKSRATHAFKEAHKSFNDNGNEVLPRHIMYGKCAEFSECPFDFKCKNYNPSYVKCQNCKLHELDGICHKSQIHNDKSYNMMISRERIDLDAEKK